MKSYSPVFLSLLLVGCNGVPASGPEFQHVEQSIVVGNGLELNGIRLNGINLNGIRLNGIRLNGIRLNGVSIGGITLSGFGLQATTMQATHPNLGTISGSQFVGAVFNGELSDGTTIAVRIDGVDTGDGSNSDLLFYRASFETIEGWSPLCGVDFSGNAGQAIPVMGTFDYSEGDSTSGSYTAATNLFTFGCRHTAIAKCIEYGYRPWQAPPSGTGTLQDHWVACTRMLRADYCGNGVPATEDGTLIDIYDGVGVLSVSTSWGVEAEWTPQGARCVNSDTSHARYAYFGMQQPSCWSSLASSQCGADFTHGGLLIDRFE